MHSFIEEMRQNKSLSDRHPNIFKLTNNDTMMLLQKICWLMALKINCIILFTYRLEDIESVSQGEDS